MLQEKVKNSESGAMAPRIVNVNAYSAYLSLIQSANFTAKSTKIDLSSSESAQ